MSKFIAIGFFAILLSGCASSSQFENVEMKGAHNDVSAHASTSAVRAKAAAQRGDEMPNHTGRLAMAGADRPSAASDPREITGTAISPSNLPGTSAYKIGPSDVIEVSVFKVPELSRTVQVSELGTINLPLLSDVAVAGKTGREVERDLARRLQAKYLQNPQVTVFMKEYNNQKITIEGAFKHPGVFPLQGSMSLLQAVATAQGLDDMSDDTVLVFRTVEGRRQAARFDVSDIRDGSSPDPQLVAGDVIVAGASEIKKSLNGFMKILPIAGFFALL